MEKQSKLTKIGLMVIICTLLIITLIGYAVFQKLKNEACKIVCGVNLKGLGTAMMVYANDYYDNFPQLPGNGPWSKHLGFDYDIKNPDFEKGGAQEKTPRSITSSLYLLVREADVSPKSFICPQSEQEGFPWENHDLTQTTRKKQKSQKNIIYFHRLRLYNLLCL